MNLAISYTAALNNTNTAINEINAVLSKYPHAHPKRIKRLVRYRDSGVIFLKDQNYAEPLFDDCESAIEMAEALEKELRRFLEAPTLPPSYPVALDTSRNWTFVILVGLSIAIVASLFG